MKICLERTTRRVLRERGLSNINYQDASNYLTQFLSFEGNRLSLNTKDSIEIAIDVLSSLWENHNLSPRNCCFCSRNKNGVCSDTLGAIPDEYLKFNSNTHPDWCKVVCLFGEKLKSELSCLSSVLSRCYFEPGVSNEGHYYIRQSVSFYGWREYSKVLLEYCKSYYGRDYDGLETILSSIEDVSEGSLDSVFYNLENILSVCCESDNLSVLDELVSLVENFGDERLAPILSKIDTSYKPVWFTEYLKEVKSSIDKKEV